MKWSSNIEWKKIHFNFCSLLLLERSFFFFHFRHKYSWDFETANMYVYCVYPIWWLCPRRWFIAFIYTTQTDINQEKPENKNFFCFSIIFFFFAFNFFVWDAKIKCHIVIDMAFVIELSAKRISKVQNSMFLLFIFIEFAF